MPRKPAPVADGVASVKVAYHDGPPAIHFAGLAWRRDVAETVTAEKWAEMRARGDFNEFAFRVDPAGTDNETEV